MRKAVAAVAAMALAVALGGCASSHPRNEDGAFEGTVERVRQDHLWLGVENGTVSIDTWSVCGDHTSRNIAVGDRLTVYADRDLFSYEAWRILDADGQPACPRD